MALSQMVSIHAPARGATMSRAAYWSRDARFNPRAREGRDAGRIMLAKMLAGFNPRAREGRDHLPQTG